MVNIVEAFLSTVPYPTVRGFFQEPTGAQHYISPYWTLIALVRYVHAYICMLYIEHMTF